DRVTPRAWAASVPAGAGGFPKYGEWRRRRVRRARGPGPPRRRGPAGRNRRAAPANGRGGRAGIRLAPPAGPTVLRSPARPSGGGGVEGFGGRVAGTNPATWSSCSIVWPVS